MIDRDPWSRLRRAGIAAAVLPGGGSGFSEHLVVVRQVPNRIEAGLNGEREVRPGGMMQLAPAVWTPMDDTGATIPDPFMMASGAAVLAGGSEVAALIQAFLDLGHALGMVPSDVPDVRGELGAVRAHLEDMRLLAGVRAAIPEHPIAQAVRRARHE